MANLDLSVQGIRSAVIKEIKGEENKRRKAESLRRFEVYKERQQRFIVEKLESEFSRKTVDEMRKILSVNLAPRMINELASIYQNPPEREFTDATDDELKQIDALYESVKADVKLLQANRYFKLNDQCAIQIVPRSQKLQARVLLPHQYDVIPDANDPEKAFAYIVSVFDKHEYINNNNSGDLSNPNKYVSPYKSAELIDSQNQKIADADDYKASLERYEVWTDQLNFIMDGNGKILSETTENVIGKLPFIDIAVEKDFEYFVRRGNGIVDFAIDFGAQLSDVANIIRMQGYAQAIVYSDKQPTDMVIGPNHILFMEIDPNRPELKPSFEFASPNADLASSMEFLEMTLRLFLTSKGIDPKTLSGKMEGKSFASGIERMLSMLDKFSASKADIELFRYAEYQMFDLMRLWSNAYQGNFEVLGEELQGGQIREEVKLNVNFNEPQAIQTKIEKEDSVIKLLKEGLVTKRRALMDLYDVDEQMADQMAEEIEEEKQLRVEVMQETMAQDQVPNEDQAEVVQ